MIPKIHPTFKLNGHALNHDGVMEVAYSYVKEGEDWEKQVGNFILSWLDDFNVVTVKTSGSTGVPKEYKLDKQHMVNSAIMTGDRFEIGAESLVMCCLPLSYIAGKMMMVRAMTLGWHIDLVQPSTTPLKKATKRYDFIAMSPLQVAKSMANIHKTRKVIIGGGAVSQKLIEELKGKHTRAFHTYGMTETASHVAIRELYPNYEEFYEALPNVRMEQNEDGRLVVHAPDLTRTSLTTNDLVELLSENKFKILGRVDDVIISGSVKIHPAQVEDKIAQHVANRLFITGIPDEDLGSKVILVVEGKKQDLQFAFKKLDKFELPKEIYFVDAFEQTHTGKVDKDGTLKKMNTVQF